MPDQEDAPLPGIDSTESLLQRIAESVERMERRQPPGASEPSSSVAPQQFANAGNIQIEGQGKEPPSFLGRAAIALQQATNMMADYGVKTPPALHSMMSAAKVGSLFSGDVHTRGEQLSSIGKRPDVGGDEQSILRAVMLGKGQDRSVGDDDSPQIARNDLKDSLDSLKESIDQLKDAVKGIATGKSQQTQSSGPAPSKAPRIVPGKPVSVRNASLSIARGANIAGNTI